MRALVTGAAGFVGGAVARELALRGNEVVSVYRRATTSTVRSEGQVEVCDLVQPDAVKGLVERVRPQLVFHLASAFPGTTDAAAATSIDTAMVDNILAACDRRTRFVLASTDLILPGEATTPFQQAYVRSKLYCESRLFERFQETAAAVSVIRFPRVCGVTDGIADVHDNRILTKLLLSAMGRLPEPVEMVVPDTSTYNFCEIQDAMKVAADMGIGSMPGSFSVSDLQGLSFAIDIFSLVSLVGTAVGKPPKVKWLFQPSGMVRVDEPTARRIMRVLRDMHEWLGEGIRAKANLGEAR